VNFLAWKILRDAPKFHPPSTLSLSKSFSDALLSMLCHHSCSPLLPAASTMLMTTNMAVDMTNATTNTTRTSSSVEEHVDGDPLPTASSSTAAILDPSRGCRGTLMGNKKAKLEHQKMAVNTKRNKRLKNIKDKLNIQTEQQICMGCVFELLQYLKTVLLTGDKQMVKRLEKS
jgi:hypothetical protein